MLINLTKRKDMSMSKKQVIYEDSITNYGITIINDKMYLIKDGKRMRLDALIIKQSRERN